MSKTTASDVKKARIVVELDGEEFTLIPSPEAILSLSMKYDGLAPLMGAIGRLNVQAMVDTVVAGLGLEGASARNMAGTVAATSLLELLPKLSEFASILANGGRPLKADKTSDEGGKGPL